MFRHPFTPSILIVILISGILMNVYADIPKVINYQGKVTDSGGAPVADGTYSMQFRIYDAEISGNLEWDSGSISVDVGGGIFEILLGESPQPALDLTFGEDYWLEMEIESDTQSSRVKLGSVGYAYMSSGVVAGTVIQGSVETGTSAALKGVNSATSGTTYGLYGECTCTEGTGAGVYGNNLASSGFATGVFGQSASSWGRGVHGIATGTSSSGIGVLGQTYATAGRGIFGEALSTAGTNYGVYGRSYSTSGRGVYAEASASSGDTYGAYCWSKSPSGCGVYGLASATSGSTRGVFGYINSPSGAGVLGYSAASTGTTHGVYGQCASSSGYGVFGVVTSTEGSTFGVYGSSASSEGKGVSGYASATSGTTYGVFGMSISPSGRGIYGQSLSSTGYGVYGYNPGGWAGGFNGNVDLNGRLVLPDFDATGITGSGSVEIGNSLRIDGNEIITNSNEILYMQRDNNGDIDIDSNTLFLDASTDRVGIDISNPGATLHVNGRMRLGQGLREFELREVMTSDDWGSGIISYEGIGIGSIDGANRQMIMFTDGGGAQNIFTVATSQNSGSSWEADFVVQQNGRVGVGTGSPGYAFQVGTNGDGTEARANAWNLLSSKKYKSDITPLEDGEYESILKQLVDTDVVRYHFYHDENKARHLGLIAEEAPRDIVTRDGEALSLSDYCAFLLAATKAQQEIIEFQHDEIEALKMAVRNIDKR